MPEGFTILFGDRSRNVRQLLRREFERDGYAVQAAGNAKDIILSLQATKRPDLLIIDPDLPLADGLELLRHIEEGIPSLPVIIHTSCTEIYTHPATRAALLLLEKTGNLDPLKRAVAEVRREREHPSGTPIPRTTDSDPTT